MKARIKATEEIVEVEDLYDDGTALVNGRCDVNQDVYNWVRPVSAISLNSL